MTLEERVVSLEHRLGKQDKLVKELRDAMEVTAELEARQSRMLRDHADWLASHDQAMLAHDRRMSEHDLRMAELDTRIAGLVSGIGELISRAAPPK